MEWLSKIKEVVLGPKISEELLKEKRRVPRIGCFIEAVFAREDGFEFEGNVSVLELTGMRAVTRLKLEKGQQVKVRVEGFTGVLLSKPYKVDTVNAEVIWCRKKRGFSQYNAGLKFVNGSGTIKDSWVQFVLESFGLKEKTQAQGRTEIRVPTNIPVKCFYRKRSFAPGVASDIGMGGIQIRMKIDPGANTEVELHVGPYGRISMLKCKGTILRAKYDPGRDEFAIGVKFKELSNKETRHVGEFIMAFLQSSAL
jgi:hypothetical protein